MLAETLKILSNYHSETKFIISGVANSAKSLVGNHLSILRNLAVISIPRMSNDEIFEIILNGTSKIKLKFSDELSMLILFAAIGLPYFTHLICEQLSYLALDNNKLDLDINDFFESLEIILMNLPEHIKISYDLACSINPAVFQIDQDINPALFNLLTHPSTVRKEVLSIFTLVDECNLKRAKGLFSYFIELGSVFESDKYKSMDELLFYDVLSEIAKISDIVVDYGSHILFKDSYHRSYALLQAANYFGKETFMKLISFK